MEQAMQQKRPRRAFTAAYKAEVVELCRRADRSIGQVARDLDLTETAVFSSGRAPRYLFRRLGDGKGRAEARLLVTLIPGPPTCQQIAAEKWLLRPQLPFMASSPDQGPEIGPPKWGAGQGGASDPGPWGVLAHTTAPG